MENPYQPSQVPPPQQPTHSLFLTLFGVALVVLITMTFPISSDFFQAPLWLKIGITAGNLVAISCMLYPVQNKGLATWGLAVVISLYAALQTMVLWYWN